MEEKNLSVQNQNQVATINFFGGVEIFKEGWNMAGVLAESDLIPQAFRGKKANCLIALNMAQRMKADPLMVMQNLAVVHGSPTFEAKFVIACFNATGKYSPIRYKMTGEKGKDSWGCIAYAIEKATGEVCEGLEITIAMAKAEKWYDQNPKWRNIPELMLRYRAASWFIRSTDPGVMMGFQTREEAEDFVDYEEVTEEAVENAAADLEAAEQANTEQIEVPSEVEATDNAPSAEQEEKEEVKTSDKKSEAAKPMGASETPELFK